MVLSGRKLDLVRAARKWPSTLVLTMSFRAKPFRSYFGVVFSLGARAQKARARYDLNITCYTCYGCKYEAHMHSEQSLRGGGKVQVRPISETLAGLITSCLQRSNRWPTSASQSLAYFSEPVADLLQRANRCLTSASQSLEIKSV